MTVANPDLAAVVARVRKRFSNTVPQGDRDLRRLRDIERVCNAAAECERLRGELAKISAIRDSIVGSQTVNWSEHVYPLVAALKAAGFEGLEYAEARENVGTLVEQNAALRAALEPFARVAEMHDGDERVTTEELWAQASIQEFRAARAALAAKGERS